MGLPSLNVGSTMDRPLWLAGPSRIFMDDTVRSSQAQVSGRWQGPTACSAFDAGIFLGLVALMPTWAVFEVRNALLCY